MSQAVSAHGCRAARPNNLYPAADHEFIHITAVSDALFDRLARLIGDERGLVDDERFASQAGRVEHHEALDDRIAMWTASLPLAELEETLLAAGIPASRIYTMADIFADAHYRARGSIAAAPDPELGSVAVAGIVPRLSRTPGAIRHAGKNIGEDTMEVLADVLGMDRDVILSLEEAGVIRCGSGGTAGAQRKPIGGAE